MGGSRELGRALRGWRDRMNPEAVGMPGGGVRRAAGLRREELAQLAGLSVDYIVRLEQGRATSPSRQVLAALARALQLSSAEREHLYILAGETAPCPGQINPQITSGVRRLLEQLDGAAVTVCDVSWNLLIWNPLAAAVLGDQPARGSRERNIAWREFTGVPSRVIETDEQRATFRTALVTDLRAATACYPADTGLRSLVAELRKVSPDFARLWDGGAVGRHESSGKVVDHPEVGPFAIDCDVLIAPGTDLKIVLYTAPAGTDSADRMRLLSVIGVQSMTP
ncbi:helix-turn-helix transcriptional regulator [Actinoplanes sp. NPDC051851]|uniref:helix-turn-helix transcriptional regulator n=1 Tax=Actinoplanes sp. NPDC051851 TaxID=3154753 RepID=UPI003412FFE0